VTFLPSDEAYARNIKEFAILLLPIPTDLRDVSFARIEGKP
jgi:hypothetical protein